MTTWHAYCTECDVEHEDVDQEVVISAAEAHSAASTHSLAITPTAPREVATTERTPVA